MRFSYIQHYLELQCWQLAPIQENLFSRTPVKGWWLGPGAERGSVGASRQSKRGREREAGLDDSVGLRLQGDPAVDVSRHRRYLF